MSIAVVIVNWERPQDTIECICSLHRSQMLELQIIVVDNGSKDDSISRISQSFPNIILVSLPQNLGFSEGYNIGIEHALKTQASRIFLLNNDTTLEPNTISDLANAPWDVSVPKILFYYDPDRIWAAGARWRKFPPAIIMNGFRKKDRALYNISRPLDYATGCALMVKRKVFETVGGFDPLFGNYMEDYDFCYRLRSANFTIGYLPQARVYHKVSQSFGESSPLRWRYLGKNTVRFYRKEDRFSRQTLWFVLAWISVRETINGRLDILSEFWSGVLEGLKNV